MAALFRMLGPFVGTKSSPSERAPAMTSTPIEPDNQPDNDPDGLPGDSPDVPTDPDQQKPDIVTEPNIEGTEPGSAP